ncbi:MAG TPA: type VI secretion system protein [Thermoanaerobaculia bacterium]|nr:type VI secretion system protein [Thermoanaerobaculia bacterium]
MTHLASYLPLLLAATVALGLLVVAGLALIASRGRLDGGLREIADDPATTVVDFSGESADSEIRASFAQAVELLSRLAPGRGGRYRLPWFVMIGGSPEANAELLASLRIPLPFGAPEPPSARSTPLGWWIFDRAVVLEASGAATAQAGDGAPAPGAWLELLRCLRATRPERPLDGLIVAIPAADLADGDPTSAAVSNRAQLLAARAAQLVEHLGFRLPVHVVIADGENLPGFTETAATIPADQRGQMLAWANPNALESAFTPTWVTEAVTALVRGFARHQLDVFAEPTLPPDVGPFYLFPQQVGSLGDVLAVYLTRLFLPTAEAEPSFFRSLALCGKGSDSALASAPPAGWDGGPPAPEVLYAEDLFAAKIFPERALARPAGTAEKRRRTALHVLEGLAAASALAAVIGLIFGPGLVSKRADPLTSWFGLVKTRLPASAAPGDRKLLEDLAAFDTLRVETWMLPASLGSGLDREVRDGVTRSHQGIFLPDTRTSLLDRRSALVDGRLPRPAPKPPAAGTAPAPGCPKPSPQRPAGAVVATPEFRDLSAFSVALTDLEGQVGRFNGFTTTGWPRPRQRLADFQSLSSYALGVPFEPPTASARAGQAAALAEADLPPEAAIPLAVDPEVQGRAATLSNALFHEVFFDSYVRLGAEQLAKDIDALGRSQGSGGQAFRQLRCLLDEIQAYEKTLTRPDQQWLVASSFSPGAAYRATLANLGRSAWLGPRFAPTVAAAGNTGFARMQDALVAISSDYVGPILASQNGKPQLKLAPEIGLLESAIQGLLGEPFVPQTPPQPWIPEIPPGQWLIWDSARLTETAGLGAAYDSFLGKGLQLFPASLRPAARDAAHNRLSLDVSDGLAAAQTFVPAPNPSSSALLEVEVQNEVSNFSAAAKPLGTILDDGVRLNLRWGVPALANLMGQQANEILGRNYRLLVASRLYEPQRGSLKEWPGSPPPSPTAFGVTSASALKGYLSAQRGRASELADNYAQPVLTGLAPAQALQPPIASLPWVARWNAILAALAAATQQTAGGSVTDLESFISGPMAQITVLSCTGALAGGGPGVQDFFSGRESQLWAVLEDRCRELVAENGRRAFCQLRASFGDELANQYPFARRDPLRLGAEAPPAAVARFFAVYDQQQPYIAQAPDSAFGSSATAVRGFMDDLAQVRAFFAPFLAAPGQPPTFDFNVVFRANRSREQGGNQIYNWSLQSGDQTIATTNPGVPSAGSSASSGGSSAGSAASGGANGPASTTLGRWTFGEPLNLAFTWADDSPWQPAQSGQEPHAAVLTPGVVTYTFKNAWSLLALLHDQASSPEDFAGFTDPDPQTLRFRMATQPVLGGSPGTPVRVYVRLELQSPDQKTRLFYPATFPADAPPFTCGGK